MALALVIGSKRYSSWSLRPWLALKCAGIPFKEILIPLRQASTAKALARHSPSGKVPVLVAGEVRIWESLAILEYLAERYPAKGLWPKARAARAHARAVAAEMHAGFGALRNALPMDIGQRHPFPAPAPGVENDVRRIEAIWSDCRARFGRGGPFLFGRFTNADAMFAPVCTRFETYGVTLGRVGAAYMKAVLALPAMAAWAKAAAREPELPMS